MEESNFSSTSFKVALLMRTTQLPPNMLWVSFINSDLGQQEQSHSDSEPLLFIGISLWHSAKSVLHQQIFIITLIWLYHSLFKPNVEWPRTVVYFFSPHCWHVEDENRHLSPPIHMKYPFTSFHLSVRHFTWRVKPQGGSDSSLRGDLTTPWVVGFSGLTEK